MRFDSGLQGARLFLTRLALCLNVTCALIVASVMRPAFADEYDALNVLVGGDVSYESNVFARPDFLDPQSDTIARGYVGLRIDKPYAQQRFQLNATANAYRYKKFSNLDFDGIDYGAAWLWYLTPRVSGTLRASRTEVPTLFEDSLATVRNTQTNETYLFDLDGQVSGGWHGLFGISQEKRKFERQGATALPSYKAEVWHVGVKYLFPSGNWISAIQRSLNGNYENRLPDPTTFISSGFDGSESEVAMMWALTGKWALSARLTYLDRSDANFPQRDFSGTEGTLVSRWNPTSQLFYALSATRDIHAYQTNFSSYRVSDTVSFRGNWAVTVKTDLRFNLYYSEYDYRGPVVVSALPQRHDIDKGAEGGVRWAATRGLIIGADVRYRVRSSNDPFANFDNSIVTLRGELTF